MLSFKERFKGFAFDRALRDIWFYSAPLACSELPLEVSRRRFAGSGGYVLFWFVGVKELFASCKRGVSQNSYTKKNILSLRRNIFSSISFLFNMCLLRTDSLVYHQDRTRTKFKKLTHNLGVLCKSLSRGVMVMLGHGDPIPDKSSEKFHDTLFFTIVVQQTLTS